MIARGNHWAWLLMLLRVPVKDRLRSVVADPDNDASAVAQFAGRTFASFPVCGVELLAAQQEPFFAFFRSFPLQGESFRRLLIITNAENDVLFAMLVGKDAPMKQCQMVAGAFARSGERKR